jgi:hypothetical protein
MAGVSPPLAAGSLELTKGRKFRYFGRPVCLVTDYDLAAGSIGFHQSMRVLNVFKTKDFGWLAW